MPRAFKRDLAETAKRNFLDERSFVALGSGCVVLFGADKSKRRMEIYNRAHGRCELQSSPHCRGFARWTKDELMDGWHHTKIHDGKKCDCAAAGKWSCGPCHRYEHRRRNPRFGEKSAVEAFNRIYGEEESDGRSSGVRSSEGRNAGHQENRT